VGWFVAYAELFNVSKNAVLVARCREDIKPDIAIAAALSCVNKRSTNQGCNAISAKNIPADALGILINAIAPAMLKVWWRILNFCKQEAGPRLLRQLLLSGLARIAVLC